MIESREQRKRTTLLHRRKVAIVASVLIVAILSVSLYFIYDYFNSVYTFRDANFNDEDSDDRKEYYIVKVDGEFGMYYDKEGKNPLKTTSPPGVSYDLFVTDIGTTVKVDGETGDVEVKTIPVSYHDNEYIQGEYLSVFEGVDTTDILEIEVSNGYGQFSIYRIAENLTNASGDIDVDNFIIKNAPLTATSYDHMSYALYYAGHVMVNSRLDGAIKDENGEYSIYGLVPETRVDAEGNEYEYTPSYYVIKTKDDVEYKIIVGDKLLDGSGYYIQCEDNGVLRDAVYILTPADNTEINETNFENTLMGPAKNFLTAAIIYPASTNDYYDVTDFTISAKDGSSLRDVVKFSYVDLEEREDTVLGIHPYVFADDSFHSYHPHYDNIDVVLQGLMDPTIDDIAVIAPTNAQKAEYGLMSATLDADGKTVYVYDSEYVIKFRRNVVDEDSGESFPLVQTIYISGANEDGNYYTFTEIYFPTADDDSPYKGFQLNMICEVSESTMAFLKWDDDDWVYPNLMQISLDYLDNVELIWNDYSAHIQAHHGKASDGTDSFRVTLTDTKDYAKNPLETYEVLEFKDNGGNTWVISSEAISVYSSTGEELKPQSLHREYNSIGRKVQVIDKFAVTAAGDKVYINKDDITIVYANGKTEKRMRYQITLFKRMFAGINSMSIVDAYHLSAEEEAALIADESKHILTIKTTDTEGEVKTFSFYAVTGRKAYVTVDGQGGFYLQTQSLTKLTNDLQRFINGENIDMDAMD